MSESVKASEIVEDPWWTEPDAGVVEPGPHNIGAEKFHHMPKRRAALILTAEGADKSNIAKWIGVHRNTVHNWSQNPIFRRGLDEYTNELIESTLARRQRQMVRINNRVADVIEDRVLPALEDKKRPVQATDVANLNALFSVHERGITQEHRLFGIPDVKEINHRVGVRGQIDHRHTGSLAQENLKGYLEARVENVKAELPPDATAAEVVTALIEDAILDGDLIQRLDAEDVEVGDGQR